MTRSGEPDERRMSRAELLRRGAALAAGAGVLGVVGPTIAAPKPPLADLARATRGPLLRPGSAAYTAARRVRNARFDGARPLAVLKARGVSDVRAAVGWSVRNGVRFTARSGGHSYAGYSTLNGGLVVDLSSLNGIAVSADPAHGADRRRRAAHRRLRGARAPGPHHPGRLVPHRRGGRARPRRRRRAGLARARHDERQRGRPHHRHGGRPRPRLRRPHQLRSLLGQPRRRRWQLRHRDRLHPEDPPGELRLVLLRVVPLEPGGRGHPRLAALGAERGRRPLLDLLAVRPAPRGPS